MLASLASNINNNKYTLTLLEREITENYNNK